MNLKEALERIKPLDKQAMKECSNQWDSICKPLYAFGKFEVDSQRIAGMTGSSKVCLDKKALVIMCGDHGVLEEGVSQSTKDITLGMVEGFPHMKCSASRMAAYAKVDLFAVDVGVASDITVSGVIDKKIAYGTKNMAKEPAMTYEEAIKSIEIGINMVDELKQKGYQIICTGEMGVGNTTPCAAMASYLLNVPVRQVTGRGSGLTNEGLEKRLKF
ncbi:Nicotinate-nucleotide--dimethylbenzimidazole phosphoribosyltransferase [Lachnospiraceae bacterium TWA4]|nr:Nicotinate-nucleotide--dimethylbenzimidazole phosphoribosyltransferase [Lachnospiraceae bacterium TWA4]